MVLPLETPVGANFIKDWVSQNTVNCDLIDAFAGPYAIQAYTPILTASSANPTLGGAGSSITGFYYRILDQIFTWGEFRFGVGFAAGSGTYEITLPFEARAGIPVSTGSGGGPTIGTGHIWDNSAAAGRQPVTVQLRTTNKLMFSVRHDSGGAGRAVDGANIPLVWAQDDGINWNVRYQRLS